MADEIAILCTLYEGDSQVPKTSHVFDAHWADKLYRACKRNLTVPFRFICLTDRLRGAFEEKAIEVVPFEIWHYVGGCMTMLECFRPDLRIQQGFYMGLDTIICGSMDEIATYRGAFAMLAHPARPVAPQCWPLKGRGPEFCGGVIGFNRQTADELWKIWTDKHDTSCALIYEGGSDAFYESDMLWCEHHMEGKIDALDKMYPGQILPYVWMKRPITNSARRRCRNIPSKLDPRIVYFYGPEKPHNTTIEQLKEHWV